MARMAVGAGPMIRSIHLPAWASPGPPWCGRSSSSPFDEHGEGVGAVLVLGGADYGLVAGGGRSGGRVVGDGSSGRVENRVIIGMFAGGALCVDVGGGVDAG